MYYLKEQWPYLLRYLEDGRLELSNNRAERRIKSFVIGRKNFLFANIPLGAQVSTVIYSMIETARETGLDHFCYLTWVLETTPTLNRTVGGLCRCSRQMHLSLTNYITFMRRSADSTQHCGSLLGWLI